MSKSVALSYTHLETILRYVAGIALYGISAILTLSLLLRFSDGSLFQTLFLVLVSLSLEGAKLLAWRSNHRFFASCLIGLSILASFGAALETVNRSSESVFAVSLEDIRASNVYKAKLTELASCDEETKIILGRLEKLPNDFTTASIKLTNSLVTVRTHKTEILDSITKLESLVGGKSPSDMFTLLGKTLHIPAKLLTLFILMALAVCIETGAIILTEKSEETEKVVNEPSEAPTGEYPTLPQKASPISSHTRPMDKETSKPNHIGPEEFLQASKCDGPYLRGRDFTAKILGISYGEAKRLVSSLITSGQIRVKGKRLVLNEQKAS